MLPLLPLVMLPRTAVAIKLRFLRVPAATAGIIAPPRLRVRAVLPLLPPVIVPVIAIIMLLRMPLLPLVIAATAVCRDCGLALMPLRPPLMLPLQMGIARIALCVALWRAPAFISREAGEWEMAVFLVFALAEEVLH